MKTAYLDKTDIEIAAILADARGVNMTAVPVSKQRYRLGLRKTARGVPLVFARNDRVKYNKPPTFDWDNCLVMGDIHAPFHDSEWCSEVLWLARKLEIRNIIIAGDLLDFNALSPFARQMVSDDEPEEMDVSDEVDEAAAFCDVLLQHFPEVHTILGNHEERLSRSFAIRLRAKVIAHLLGYRQEKRFKIYPYFYAIIRDSSGQKWRVSHPKNTSVVPIQVARRLADKVQMHCICAHGHDWGESTSVSGFYAASCGGCVDPAKLAYSTMKDNLRPVMQQGAWLLVDGQPMLLHPKYRHPTEIK